MADESPTDVTDASARIAALDDGGGTKKKKKKKKARNSSMSLGVSEHSQSASKAEGGTAVKRTKKKKKRPSSGNLSSSEPVKLTFKVGSDGTVAEVGPAPTRREQALGRMHSVGDLNGGVSSDVEDNSVASSKKKSKRSPVKPRKKDKVENNSDRRADGMFDVRRMTSFSQSTIEREDGKNSFASAMRGSSPPPARKRGSSPPPQSGFGNFGGGDDDDDDDDSDDSSNDGGGGVDQRRCIGE